MRKSGLFFATFIFLSLFLVPSTTFAQGNEDTGASSGTKSTWDVEKNAIVQKAIYDMSTVPDYNKYSDAIASTQNKKLQEIADNYFKNKTDYNTTYNTAAASIYNEFGKYLATTLVPRRSVLGVDVSNDINDVINAEFAVINNLYTLYHNAAEVSSGRMSTSTEALENARVAARNANIAKPVGNPNDVNKCSINWDSDFSVTECANQLLTSLIKTFFLNIAGFLVWVSANMLNYAIQVGILNFSKWAPDTLYPIWIVVRQIVSLFIVFAGLYLGLMYIIGKDEKFEKYIPWVVIFALFVNFSYPLVRTAIDVSNVISLNIYASAVGNNALIADVTSKDTAGALIMEKLGLQGLVLSATSGSGNDSSSMITSISSPAGALMALVFVLYAAYIFFMVTALIIMRTASLIFIIIASPILFIDSVIPKLGEQAMKLRQIFFEQLAVGPIFMIMLALTLKFLTVFGLATKGSVGGSGASNATITEFFNIAMMLIMLHIMLKVTKSTSGSVGQMATNAMGKVGGFAGGIALGAATGGAGLLARGTMGRAAASIRDSKWVTNNQNGVIGRHAYNMSNSVAKSSFDARNSSYVQTGAKKLGLSMGMGANTNYERDVDARVQDRKERYARIKTENADGTINEDGAKAKQNFFASQGMVGGNKFSKALGLSQSKDKVGNALTSADIEQAEAQDKKMVAYDKRTGAAKQEKFYTEKDQAMQNQMIESDRAKAEAENKKIDQYDKLSNKAKQTFYEKQTDDVKEATQERDRRSAVEMNSKIDAVDKLNLEEYNKMSKEDKQQYYSKQSDYLKEKLKKQDEGQARNSNEYREEILNASRKTSDPIQTSPNTNSSNSQQTTATKRKHEDEFGIEFA